MKWLRDMTSEHKHDLLSGAMFLMFIVAGVVIWQGGNLYKEYLKRAYPTPAELKASE